MLKDLDVVAFADRLASSSPTPGGGSAAARAALDGAALIVMVASITSTKESFATVRPAMQEAERLAREQMAAFAADVDADADAYVRVTEAARLPKGNGAERQRRQDALEAALRGAAEVPRRVAERALELLEILPGLVREAIPKAAPDLGVAGHLLASALRGALLNVDANIGNLSDRTYVDELRHEQHELLEEARRLASDVEHEVRTRIG